jgi:hypothetical protein
VFYIFHSVTSTGPELSMRVRQRNLSLAYRILRLSLTWLFIGALIGAVGVERKSGGIEIVYTMIGGMIVLTILGILLGVIGGDARGSVVGVFGGIVGCWLANLRGAALQPQLIGAVVIFSGLLGATGFLFIRVMLWKYRMMFRCVRRLTDMAPVSGRVSAVAGQIRVAKRMAGNPSPHKIPSTAKRIG